MRETHDDPAEKRSIDYVLILTKTKTLVILRYKHTNMLRCKTYFYVKRLRHSESCIFSAEQKVNVNHWD